MVLIARHRNTIASKVELFCASSEEKHGVTEERWRRCKKAEAQQVSGGASLVSQIQKNVRRHHQHVREINKQVREKTSARCSAALDMVKEEEEIQILNMG